MVQPHRRHHLQLQSHGPDGELAQTRRLAQLLPWLVWLREVLPGGHRSKEHRRPNRSNSLPMHRIVGWISSKVSRSIPTPPQMIKSLENTTPPPTNLLAKTRTSFLSSNMLPLAEPHPAGVTDLNRGLDPFGARHSLVLPILLD